MAAGEPAGRGDRLTTTDYSLAAVALALVATIAWQSATLFRLDLAFTRSETELSFWGRGGYQPTEATLVSTVRELDALLVPAPTHPDYLTLAAYHFAWLAYREDDPTVAQGYALRAANAQFSAQQSRPAYRQGWAKMVGYARRAGSVEGAGALRSFAQQRLDALQLIAHTNQAKGA